MNTVSVVMATYNGEKYIYEQLESLKSQNYKNDEVVICDDCSTDNTKKIVLEFIRDNNLTWWHFIQNNENYGYAKNFINAVKKSKGDIVFFCDQDDIWNNEKIYTMLSIIKKNNNINLLCSNLELYYSDDCGRKWDKKDLKDMNNSGDVESRRFDEKNFFVQRSGCTMCFRREFFEKISSYWVDNWAHDDFMWKFACITDTNFVLQKFLMKRRMHNDNTSSIKVRTKQWRKEQIKDLNRQLESIQIFSEKEKVNYKYKKIISKNLRCLKCRYKFIDSKNPIYLLTILIKYIKCFPRMKALLLDIYITYIGTYRGVN